MTNDERNDAIRKLLAQRKKQGTKSREAARKTLIAEGVYTKSGKVSPQYGGPTSRDKKPKKVA